MKTRIVTDIKKVQHASFFYHNQVGITVSIKPRCQSVNGLCFQKDELAFFHYLYPGETCLERATRLGILDVWTPAVVFTFAANHTIKYEGKKAIDMWKAWNKYIFKKTK